MGKYDFFKRKISENPSITDNFSEMDVIPPVPELPLTVFKNELKNLGTLGEHIYRTGKSGSSNNTQLLQNLLVNNTNKSNNTNTSKNNFSISATGINAATDYLSDYAANSLFGNDTDVGRVMGTLFSLGVSSAGNTMANNLTKRIGLTTGLGRNVGSSLAGAGAGIAANYLGLGITSMMGDSRLGRALGQGVSTGLGAIGGTAAGNLVSKGSVGTLFGKGAGMINPYGLGMSVVGSALGAATDPSKEYGGTYGGITKTMDTVYDLATSGANFIPGAGQIISGAMVLNKGLSNIFGSTDGMTKTDAILGSAFMPAPIKWINMWGSSKTGNFNDLSWQNSEKVNSFMGDAFGDLDSKFARAREEAGKVYGTFSLGAKRDAQANLDYANAAWGRLLQMVNEKELQNIRSQYMSSINNLRYAQSLNGYWSPLAIGRQGMKILNNATNHNIGMRLLSGAALIDNKQMILCNVPD